MLMWGPFRPDVGGPNSGFAETADNVIPQAMGYQSSYGFQKGIGYGPTPQLVTTGGATALSGGAPRGTISLTTQSGSNEVFTATATTIEQLQADFTWSSIETGRTVTSGDDVCFVHFGSFLLNTDKTDGVKAYNVETPAGNNAVSGAPLARFGFSCNNVVFWLDCDGNPLKMVSSGIGDHTTYTTLGANSKIFEDGGSLQCGVDLKNGNGLVFQSSAMRLIQFGNAASPALYSITKAADGRGSVGERSVAAFDGMVFFLDQDGFWKFDLSGGNTPIGAEKVNRWFLSNINASNLPLVQAAVDPKRKVVMWRFPSLNSTSTVIFDRIIGYHWQLDEWFTATVNTTALARIATPGYVLDSMDPFGVLDSITTLLDDRFWQGGAPLLSAIDSNFKFATFSGPPMAATLQSYTTNNPFNSLENEITPISDNSNSMISLGVQRKLDDNITWKDPRGRTRSGKVKLRGSGMNISFQETHSAGDDWTFANGVDSPMLQQVGPV